MRAGVDPPLLLLALIGWFAAGFGTFIRHAPNRLAEGVPFTLAAAVPGTSMAAIALPGACLLALGLLRRLPWIDGAVLAAAALLLLAVIAAAGEAAAERAGLGGPAARTSLDAGFWVLALAAGGIIADRLRRIGGRSRTAWLLLAPLAAGVAALDTSGRLDAVSLVAAFEESRAALAAALFRHLLLVLAALVPALAIGLPLGIRLAFGTRWRRPVLTLLNLVQTIPAMALFGLLMTPLAMAGLPGIGFLPAAIALTLYALLPIVRNTEAGIRGVDPAIVETARGLGFAPHQLFWRLQLPLALPMVLAGIRIALVQSIGLAVVAALIGAGGLGSFVFEGLGLDSIDRVLLGAVPAVGLALLAHAAMRGSGRLAARRDA